MEPLFTLTKHDLEVTKFASKDGTRPMLTCIQARLVPDDEGRVELLATNGYMAVWHKIAASTKEKFEPFLIPAEVLDQVNKLIGTKKQWINQVYVFSDRIELKLLNITITYRVPEGNYPELDKLVGENIKPLNGTGQVKLDPKYVKIVNDFMRADNSVDIKVNDKMQPVEFTSNNTYAVVMPLRG